MSLKESVERVIEGIMREREGEGEGVGGESRDRVRLMHYINFDDVRTFEVEWKGNQDGRETR